jgi:hypothetical protein
MTQLLVKSDFNDFVRSVCDNEYNQKKNQVYTKVYNAIQWCITFCLAPHPVRRTKFLTFIQVVSYITCTVSKVNCRNQKSLFWNLALSMNLAINFHFNVLASFFLMLNTRIGLTNTKKLLFFFLQFPIHTLIISVSVEKKSKS